MPNTKEMITSEQLKFIAGESKEVFENAMKTIFLINKAKKERAMSTNTNFVWTDELVQEYADVKESTTIEWFKKFNLRYSQHLKSEEKNKPLFTTTDGKDIYEGDVYWYVSKEAAFLSAWDVQSTNIAKNPINVYGIFSTEEAANEYVLMNKPCLSVEDFIALWKHENVRQSPLISDIKELAKQKINGI